MFGKKPNEDHQDTPQTARETQQPAPPAGRNLETRPPASTQRPAPAPRPTAGNASEGAFIGASIQIHGELRGDEDVFVEGQIHGTVHLVNNTLTIGNRGKLKANVYAHTVLVDGHIEGDLYGSEQVLVRKSAEVRGNITSPRVSLEDGATFKGSIEMDPEAVKSALGASSQSSSRTTAPARPVMPANNGSASSSQGTTRPT